MLQTGGPHGPKVKRRTLGEQASLFLFPLPSCSPPGMQLWEQIKWLNSTPLWGSQLSADKTSCVGNHSMRNLIFN